MALIQNCSLKRLILKQLGEEGEGQSGNYLLHDGITCIAGFVGCASDFYVALLSV